MHGAGMFVSGGLLEPLRRAVPAGHLGRIGVPVLAHLLVGAIDAVVVAQPAIVLGR